MRNFEYYTPTQILFGKDTHLQAGSLLKKYGAKKVLIHYGGQSAVRSGLIDEITSNLKEEGLEYITLGGVIPNPLLSKVREGIELCQKEHSTRPLSRSPGLPTARQHSPRSSASPVL